MTDTRPVRIYGLRPVGSEKFLWVGQTTQPIQYRKRKHWIHAVRSQAKAPISVWFRELGPDGIEAVELEVCDVSQKIERETFWILELKTLTRDGGLNTRLSYGWLGGRPDAAESARKMNEKLAADSELRQRARKANTESIYRYWAGNSEARERAADRTRQLWSDPDYKASQLAGMKRAFEETDLREKLSKGQQRRFSTDDGRAHLSSMGKIGGTKGGRISGHNRWHVARDIVKPDCALCIGGS